MTRFTNHGDFVFEQSSTLGQNHPFWGPHSKWWPGQVETPKQKETDMACGGCNQPNRVANTGPVDIKEWYKSEKNAPPDFHAHMDTLKELCASIKHATEMSIWPKQAYLAIAAGMPDDGVLISVSLGGKPWWPKMAASLGARFKMTPQNSLTADIEPTELLFIDSEHTAQRTYDELTRHAGKVSKYIVIHTVARDTFGERGDDGGPGVMAGVRQWLREGASREWVVKRFDEHNHGLVVLSRDPEDHPKIKFGARSALRFVRSKIKHKLNGSTYLPLPMAQERLDICLTCDSRGGQEGNNCKICKCFLAEIPDYAPVNHGQPGKAFIPTEGCPIGKWHDRPNDGVSMTGEEVEAMLETLRAESEKHHAEAPAAEESSPVAVEVAHVAAETPKQVDKTYPLDRVFSMSGDLGDIICALPVIRTLGGGKLVLYPSNRTTVRMTMDRAAVIAPLLVTQPYISTVQFADNPEGIDLDSWRNRIKPGTLQTALDAISETFLHGARLSHEVTWLKVPPERRAAVVFHRTLKDNQSMDWKRLLKEHPDSVFVGLKQEHEAFESDIGPIPYVETTDLLKMAAVISGADRVICNQSVGLIIAYGLGKPVICETNRKGMNCAWNRKDCEFRPDPRLT